MLDYIGKLGDKDFEEVVYSINCCIEFKILEGLQIIIIKSI